MHQCTMEDLVAHSGPITARQPRTNTNSRRHRPWLDRMRTFTGQGTEPARRSGRYWSVEHLENGDLHPGEDGMPTASTNRRRIARFPCSDLMPSTPIVRSIETSRRLAKQHAARRLAKKNGLRSRGATPACCASVSSMHVPHCTRHRLHLGRGPNSIDAELAARCCPSPGPTTLELRDPRECLCQRLGGLEGCPSQRYRRAATSEPRTPRQEHFSIHGALDHHWGHHFVVTQGGHEGNRLPCSRGTCELLQDLRSRVKGERRRPVHFTPADGGRQAAETRPVIGGRQRRHRGKRCTKS